MDHAHDDDERVRTSNSSRCGCDLKKAASHAGCSYPTIRRETLRHSEFRHKLRQALKMKAEINSLRGSNKQLNHTLIELQQKLGVPPSDSRDVEFRNQPPS